MFSKVHAYAIPCAIYNVNNKSDDDDDEMILIFYFQRNIKFTKYYTMMECQLLHHIDTQIIETIEKLERSTQSMTMSKLNVETFSILILNGDCVIKKMSEEYRQMGLLFTFNINEKPNICYEAKIVSSLVVLEAMSDILLRLEFQGISLNADSQFESEYIE